nr:uncharacterized protein LOC117272989 [Nicotiana tomentosiformis]
MTYDINLFKEFTSMGNKKVRIGNGDYILAKGKGTIAIATNSGTKQISNVLYVPDIEQNLLSVEQLMKKGFKVSFEDKHCFIYDATGLEILRIKMRGKNFSFDPTEDEKWSQKNLQSADNPPTEDICENEAKKKSTFQRNKIWKKVDKPQGKIQIWKKVDKPQDKRRQMGARIAIIVSATVGLVKKRGRIASKHTSAANLLHKSFTQGSSSELPVFSFKCIETATKNFCP